MKTFILIAASVSALCAGSVVEPLIDYDKQDVVEAKTQVRQKLILPVMKQPVLIAPGVRKKSFYYNYELDLLAGKNFADANGPIYNDTTVGIRLNRYITNTIAVQLGYDRIFDAAYKTPDLYDSTAIDRIYLNMQKDIRPQNSNFIPYLFAGAGYEYVTDPDNDLESQGFLNAGGGLKYSFSEKVRLVSEAKVIKKFNNNTLDIVTMLGAGLLFGEASEEAPETEARQLAPADEPKPESQDLTTIILNDKPKSTIQKPVTIAVNNKPKPANHPKMPTIILDDEAKNNISTPSQPTVTQPIERVRLDLNELHHSGNYYIQVAALSSIHTADSLIYQLKRRNLRVVVKSATVRGKEIKRILTGPYMQRSEARADLPRVRRVSPDAFIKKLP